MRLRMTVVIEYDADPVFYETTDPEEMAAIDQKQWASIVEFALQDGEIYDIKVKTEPIGDR